MVVRTGKPIMLADISAQFDHFKEDVHGRGRVRGWMGVPLLFQERLIGMLALDKFETNFYRPEHARLAEAFAAQAATAIENARLFQETQRHASEMAALAAIGLVISAVVALVGWWLRRQDEEERRERARREKEEERERELLEAEAEEQAALAREIAELETHLVDEGALEKVSRETDLIRLRDLAASFDALPNRAQRALDYAEPAKTEAALILAQREMQRLAEEEEMAVVLMLAMMD
jgi:GAF domain-containing protein